MAKLTQQMRDRVRSSWEIPTVSFRFFVVTSGPIIEKLLAIREQNNQAWKEARKASKAAGASSVAAYRGGWMFCFREVPDARLWKLEFKQGTDQYYKPSRRTTDGRKLAETIKKLAYPADHNDALTAVDLPTWPAVVNGNTWYRPVLWGWYDGPLFLVKVPWRAYAPEILQAYKVMRDKGEYMSAGMDYALWQPHTSMREVKEWEALKIDAERKEKAE